MWKKGIENGLYFEIKHYDEPSQYGIDGGRISKLWIEDGGKCVCNYDRGWDIEPENDAVKAIYSDILAKYN